MYIDGTGAVYITHPKGDCGSDVCVVHNPSVNHMMGWKTYIRVDRDCLVERICPHDIGHPDIDSLRFFLDRGNDSMGVHGCDRCCDPKKWGWE